MTKAKDARGLETHRAGSGNRFLLYHHSNHCSMPAKKNDTKMQSLTPAPAPDSTSSVPQSQQSAGASTQPAQTAGQSNSQSNGQSNQAQPETPKAQGMSTPEGGYPEKSEIGQGNPNVSLSPQGTETSRKDGIGANAPQQELPNGAAVRQGPNGPMHKHPGYEDSAGHLKWHPVSQRHGRGTEQMHADAGLGADGLGSTPEMRMAVGANMKEGGGLVKPPSTAEKHPIATVGAHAGLAALETIANTAGKGMSAVTNFTRAVLSGNPLSPASSLLADTFDGMASVKQSLDNTYRKYGIDPGADMASIKDTVRGGMASKQIEAQNAGYQRAFNNIDQKLADIAGSPDADISQLGANQLDLYYQTLSEDADRLLQDYNDAREKGTLTPEMQRAYDAEIEVYASAFGVIAKQGEANKKKYSELARDLKAQRASERAKVREQQEKEKQALAARHKEAYDMAVAEGDFATKVMYDLGDKYYDAEKTQNGVLVDSALRAKYEKTLQDKIDSGAYSPEETQSMQARLDASKVYSHNQKLKEKKQKRTTSMERDWGADDLNVVDTIYDQNNALGRTNKHGVVVGDKISPRLHNDLYTAAMDRVEALKANGMSEEEALKDSEVRRALTASRLQEWTYDTYKVIPELTRIPQATLDEKGKTIEDVDAAKREIYDKYNELMDKYSFVTDDPKSWNGALPTSQDRTDFKRLVDQTRREFGIWKEKKSKGETADSIEKPAPQEAQEKPVEIWLSEPKGQTPTGQRIQSRDTGNVYEPQQLEVAAGKVFSGGRNNAQTQMLVKFMETAPGINEKDNLSNPSPGQRREIIVKWPDAIRELKSENNPNSDAVANEMTKYLDFVYQDQAWRDILSTTRNGDPQLNQKYAGYNDFLEEAHRNLADPDTGEINLDDLPDINTRKAAIKAEYSNITPQNVGKPVKTEEEQAENVEYQAETSENPDEQAEIPEETPENEVKLNFSGLSTADLEKYHSELYSRFEELSKKESEGTISEAELEEGLKIQAYLQGTSAELRNRYAESDENEQESVENPAKIDENAPKNTEKIDKIDPENTEKIDENAFKTDEKIDENAENSQEKGKLPQTYDELIETLNSKSKKKKGIQLKDLSDRELEILNNNYLKEMQKYPKGQSVKVVYDEEEAGDEDLDEETRKKKRKWHSEVEDPVQYVKFGLLNTQHKKVKAELKRRGNAKIKQEKLEEAIDEGRKREEGEKGKFEVDTKEFESPKQTVSKTAHTDPFIPKGLAEPQDASWEHIKNKKKDYAAIANVALRYDPTGHDYPIIPEDADMNGVKMEITIQKMQEATMSLRKYLAQTAFSIGDGEMEDAAYTSKNPWQTAEEFCEKYEQSSPESVKDLRQRISDSYDAIREQFEKETGKKAISHRQAQAERRANEQASKERESEEVKSEPKEVPMPDQEALDRETQIERINNIGEGIISGIDKLASKAREMPKAGWTNQELNDRRTEIRGAQQNARKWLKYFKNSDLPYDKKMEMMQRVSQVYTAVMNNYIYKSVSLENLDFNALPNELRKSFANEFDKMTVHLAGYASLHPDIVPGHTVASTVDIMLRSPELLNDNYHRYVSEVVGGFRRRVETMLYESLTGEQN